jgi:hypothetical protein
MIKQFKCVIVNKDIPYDKRNVLVCIQRDDTAEIKKIEKGMFGNIIEIPESIDDIEISTKRGTIKGGKIIKEEGNNESMYISLK